MALNNATRFVHALRGYRVKALRLIGRATGDGPPEEIAIGDGLELSAENVLSATGGGAGSGSGQVLQGDGPPGDPPETIDPVNGDNDSPAIYTDVLVGSDSRGSIFTWSVEHQEWI